MKSYFFILFIGSFFNVIGQTNDLKLDSTFHRSNVGGFYPKGLEYFQIPQNQIRSIECSAIVANIGTNDITNCYLQVELEYDGIIIFTYHSDSIFMASGYQDSLFLNTHFDLIGQPIGEYTFNYQFFSDSLEIDYANNSNNFNFEITESTLSRSDFVISDSTDNYYPDSLGIESFGYVFYLENDACLSAVSPWVTHDFSNTEPSTPTNASLFVLDTIDNVYDPIGVTGCYVPTIAELGNRYKIPFYPWHNELLAGNTYLITINTPSQFQSFYLCQKTLDSTVYRAFTDGAPGGSYIENTPLVNARIIKMDIEFETGMYCNLNKPVYEINKLNIYPNPSFGKLFIEYNFDKNEQYTIQLIDIKGRLILEYTDINSTNGTFIIDQKNISDGVYIVKLLGRNFSIAERVVIQTSN